MIDDLKRFYSENREMSMTGINLFFWIMVSGFIAPSLVSSTSTFLVIVGFVLFVWQSFLLGYYLFKWLNKD